ncbi:MAG: preprotein translocase subunit SecY [Candidatus Diapherotrites archaeon]|uniref:Protein translocase subunit SecY n=1 Tax=Candidatus Iainarchaeum sp. TaxID=3101447 RepID=A0A8T4L8Y4_9ARCH|nr:preprotein translocase subunit SecY [Candidatus Diapherotrites archaeon]
MGAIDFFVPIYSLLPEVRHPEVQPPLKTKLMWTAVVLGLFYVMGNINVIGIDVAKSAGGQLEQLQVILASSVGSLITVGIGPIVLASIILQLLVGAKIIELDVTQKEDKAKFTGMQKLLTLVLSFFEAGVYVFSGLVYPLEGMFPLVVAQIAFGSILLMYLDEVVSKYGIGSGISLFIAAGVAADIVWRVFLPPTRGGLLKGLLFVFIDYLGAGDFGAALISIMPLLFTLIVFFVVTFAEGIHVNIPITMGRKGTGGRFPVKFLYVSNMPVILAVALFANVRLWAELAKNTPVLGMALSGVAAVVQPPNGFIERLFLQGAGLSVFNEIAQSVVRLQFVGSGGLVLHALLYIVVLTVVCVLFGRFWIDMANQGPEAVSQQLDKAGMMIPGFRRDPRVIRRVLERYIPPISILGSAFVGLLSGFADLTGALGSGTGILLTVGIVYRLYEELARLQLMEMHPLLGKLFGQG